MPGCLINTVVIEWNIIFIYLFIYFVEEQVITIIEIE